MAWTKNKKYPIALIEAIDKEFNESGMAVKDHDGSKGPSVYDFVNKDELRVAVGKIVGVDVPFDRRGFFTRAYEVYTNPLAKGLIETIKTGDRHPIKAAKAQFDLFLLHQSFVKLVFDYRSNVGNVVMTDKEFNELSKVFLSLKSLE